MSDKICGHIKIFGCRGVEFICIREPHEVPAPPEVIQMDHAGPHTVKVITESDKHRMVPRRTIKEN